MKKAVWLVPFLGAALVLQLFSQAVETAVPAAQHHFGSVLILDAGHGGADGGAVAEDGTEEADINLEIVLCMREILGLYGIVPILTRSTEDICYPAGADTLREKKVWDQNRRLELVRSQDHAVFLSVHQNQFSDPSVRGAQILWAPTEGSEAFAVWLQTLLCTQLDPENGRKAAAISGEIWLMNRLECPAILAECGFLSNDEECSLLKDPAYQREISAILVSGYLTWTECFAQYGGMFDGEDDLLLHGLR